MGSSYKHPPSKQTTLASKRNADRWSTFGRTWGEFLNAANATSLCSSMKTCILTELPGLSDRLTQAEHHGACVYESGSVQRGR